MILLKIWLLAIATNVSSGENIAVQPQMFPTAQDCEQVLRNLPTVRNEYYHTYRCVQTTVVVPK